MTAVWVLMSASGALLAARQGRDPHSTDGPGSGKWERGGGIPGETLRGEHKGDQAALTCTLCESSTGLGCVVSLGEQSRALCAQGTALRTSRCGNLSPDSPWKLSLCVAGGWNRMIFKVCDSLC